MWIEKVSKLPAPCYRLIALNSLFQGGRLFVGAISALYFFSFGFAPKDFVFIKSLQAVIFIALDLPLGFFMNCIGDYRSLFLSLLLGFLGAIGYLLSQSLTGFMLSESLLALSLSIWPVALSSYSMRSIKEKEEGLIENFFHRGDAISNIFIVICGACGALLYGWSRSAPYVLFAFSYLIGIIFLLLYLQNVSPLKRRKNNSHSLPSIEKMKPILPFALLLFFVQLIMQPLLHYWQPFFVENYETSSKDMSFIFVSYSLMMSAVSTLYSRFTKNESFRSMRFPFCGALAGGTFFLFLTWVSFYYEAVLIFSLLYALFNLTQVSISVHIQRRLENSERLVATKTVSFLSRIGMMSSFGVIHFLLSRGGSIHTLYVMYGLGGLAFFSILTFFYWTNKEEKIVFQNQSNYSSTSKGN